MYVDIGSIDTINKRITWPKTLDGSEAPSRARQRLQTGDVVISMTRPNLNAVALVTDEYDGSIGSTGLWVLRPVAVDGKWLHFRLQTHDFVQAMTSLVQGVLYPAIKGKDVLEFEVVYPPIDEQQQIVEAIETQFARLDAAVAYLEAARTRLKRYRASVLNAACEGRLLPTDRHRWTEEPLGAHIEKIEAGKNVKCHERPPQPDEVGIVKISAVTWGKFNQSESKTCHAISMRQEQLMIREGDFLISRANTLELVGACVTVEHIDLPLMLSDKVLRVRFKPSMLPKWALYFLRSPQGRQEIESRATGNQLSMRNIGQDRIRAIPIPVPSLEEQRKVVDEVERRMSVVEHLEATIDANLKRAATLRQAILSRAFSGGVVPPTSPDEPAKALRVPSRAEQTHEAARTNVGRASVPQRIPKSNSELRRLEEVLAEHPQGLDPRRLLQLSGFDESSVDDFYAQLKISVTNGTIVERRIAGNDVVLDMPK